ncbi:MAG: SGNH/GDSL hydrolase family protein [Nitrosomonadales bacterium]|nr:SGNH/GDSL hydrolase family protein [Nitrosomonadales bacterium]
MHQFKLVTALLLAIVLASCGGGGNGNQAPKVKFSSQVSFGDSLSDVGTYKVPAITAAGGGQYTINGTGKNWTELMAAQLGLPAPCPAANGGFGVTETLIAGCTNYAQGGARVTSQPGPGNGLLTGGTATSAQLTVPVATQIQRHLATLASGTFKGDEIVFVMAGANDVFYQLAATAPANPPGAVFNVGTAAVEMAGYVNTQIVGKGAKYVVVINVPDIISTPSASAWSTTTKALVDKMVTTYNSQLQSLLAGNPNVLYVDAYTISRDQVANPGPYGLSNVTAQACDSIKVASSLICSSATLIPGVVDHYLFADGVHPTPYGYWLLARLVSKEMLTKGWL